MLACSKELLVAHKEVSDLSEKVQLLDRHRERMKLMEREMLQMQQEMMQGEDMEKAGLEVERDMLRDQASPVAPLWLLFRVRAL